MLLFLDYLVGHQTVAASAGLRGNLGEASAIGFERVLTTEEASALLEIHPEELQEMEREGIVPAFRVGDLWRFRPSALDEWLRFSQTLTFGITVTYSGQAAGANRLAAILARRA